MDTSLVQSRNSANFGAKKIAAALQLARTGSAHPFHLSNSTLEHTLSRSAFFDYEKCMPFRSTTIPQHSIAPHYTQNHTLHTTQNTQHNDYRSEVPESKKRGTIYPNPQTDIDNPT